MTGMSLHQQDLCLSLTNMDRQILADRSIRWNVSGRSLWMRSMTGGGNISIIVRELMYMALYGSEEGLDRRVWVKRGWFWMVKCHIESYNERVASFACFSCLDLATSRDTRTVFILIYWCVLRGMNRAAIWEVRQKQHCIEGRICVCVCVFVLLPACPGIQAYALYHAIPWAENIPW